MTKKPKRPRVTRRVGERRMRKEVREREDLAAQLPGGAPEHPIEVPTPAVIEGRARRAPCPQCGGRLRIEDQAAVPQEDGSILRDIQVVCTRCHVHRSLWFRVVRPTIN